jgi:hypothetical protein
MKKVLINFRADPKLISSFDKTCKVFNLDRTKMITYLIRKHVQENSDKVRAYKTAQEPKILGTSIQDREKFFNYQHQHQYW